MTKFYLGGGRSASKGESSLAELYKNVEEIVKRENIKEILHVPFARPGIRLKSLGDLPEMFSAFLAKLGINYLNALYIEDIEMFSGDAIYMNGGDNCEFLLNMCKHEKLNKAISNSRVIIGQSCGTMILGEYFRDDATRDFWVKGLGLIQDTNIEPHYTAKNKFERLHRGIKENRVKKGLGVDDQTFVVYENGEYGDVIGSGKVFYV